MHTHKHTAFELNARGGKSQMLIKSTWLGFAYITLCPAGAADKRVPLYMQHTAQHNNIAHGKYAPVAKDYI